MDAEIDANLKRAFDDISNEAIPDRLASLLAALRESEASEEAPPPARRPEAPRHDG